MAWTRRSRGGGDRCRWRTRWPGPWRGSASGTITPPTTTWSSEAPTGHVNAQKLGYRYKAALKRAGLRELRFHDLRHTFGTVAINRADIVQVQAWMGQADIKTTQRYLHYKSRENEAERLSGAFAAGADEALPFAA